MSDISIANKHYFVRHYKIFQSRLLLIRLLRAFRQSKGDFFFEKHHGCAVWHTCLPSFLVEKIERIQKRFFRVIFPHLSYREALAFTGYPRLEDNRQSLCLKLFNKLETQPSLKLSHLVPCTRYESHGRLLRGGINLSSYKCRTGRYRNSFFPTMTEVYNQYCLSS